MHPRRFKACILILKKYGANCKLGTDTGTFFSLLIDEVEEGELWSFIAQYSARFHVITSCDVDVCRNGIMLRWVLGPHIDN